MATINYSDGAVKTVGTAGLTTSVSGHGASGPPLFSGAGGRAEKVVTGKFSFDASYPTGGEDISDIADQFAGNVWNGIVFQSPNVVTKRLAVDNTNKKVKVFIEDATSGIEAEAAAASDQSGISGVSFMAWGYV